MPISQSGILLQEATTTSDSFRGGLLVFLAMGVVGPLLWLLFKWASPRAMRRIWVVSLPIWFAGVCGSGRLSAALEEQSLLAVAAEVPYALGQLIAAGSAGIALYLFAHWLANGHARDASVDD